VRWALKTTSEQQHQPLLLVQPSPPMDSPQQIYPYLSAVDYLVGSEWELRNLLPAAGPDVDFDDIVRQLLNLGVRTVCAVEQLTCRIRSRRIHADVRAPAVAMEEAPAAREAFSAALMYQLLTIGRDLNTAALEWAATAMAANIQLTHIPESMPGPDEVENLMQANKLTGQA
jgi:ribokinase